MTDNLARHRALLELERSHDGLPPPYERAAAIRGARTERENLEHDLGIARWASASYWDWHIRSYGRGAMKARRRWLKSAKADENALAKWKYARRNLDFHLSGGKAGERREWAAKRDLVHNLENRLAALGAQAPTSVSQAP